MQNPNFNEYFVGLNVEHFTGKPLSNEGDQAVAQIAKTIEAFKATIPTFLQTNGLPLDSVVFKKEFKRAPQVLVFCPADVSEQLKQLPGVIYVTKNESKQAIDGESPDNK